MLLRFFRLREGMGERGGEVFCIFCQKKIIARVPEHGTRAFLVVPPNFSALEHTRKPFTHSLRMICR